MCKKQGTQIVEPEQLFLRHLLEAWTDPNTGHPTSQAFRPTRTEDEDCLSVDRAMSTTAADAFALAHDQPPNGFGNNVTTTWAVSLSEVTEVELSVWHDPVEAKDGKPANPQHAVVDFAGLGTKQQVKAAQKLKAKAATRGRQHPVAA